jgi:hypothetical protein
VSLSLHFQSTESVQPASMSARIVNTQEPPRIPSKWPICRVAQCVSFVLTDLGLKFPFEALIVGEKNEGDARNGKGCRGYIIVQYLSTSKCTPRGFRAVTTHSKVVSVILPIGSSCRLRPESKDGPMGRAPKFNTYDFCGSLHRSPTQSSGEGGRSQ